MESFLLPTIITTVVFGMAICNPQDFAPVPHILVQIADPGVYMLQYFRTARFGGIDVPNVPVFYQVLKHPNRGPPEGHQQSYFIPPLSMVKIHAVFAASHLTGIDQLLVVNNGVAVIVVNHSPEKLVYSFNNHQIVAIPFQEWTTVKGNDVLQKLQLREGDQLL